MLPLMLPFEILGVFFVNRASGHLPNTTPQKSQNNLRTYKKFQCLYSRFQKTNKLATKNYKTENHINYE